MSWEPTDSFVDHASKEVMDLIDKWKQRDGADDLTCGLILEALSKSLLAFAEGPDPTGTAHGFPDHHGRVDA